MKRIVHFIILGVVLIAGIAFLVTYTNRCSTKPVDYQQALIKKVTAQRDSAIAASEKHKKQSDDAFERGRKSQEEKVIIRTIFRKDTANNHRMRKHLKDSLIKAMFSREPEHDSSNFSQDVANGVLDMKSENTMLKAEAKKDSTTIAEFTISKQEADAALTKSNEALKDQTTLLDVSRENEAQARKQAGVRGVLNKVLGAAVVVLGIVAISK